MREFICGQATLLSCVGEATGWLFGALVTVVFVALLVMAWRDDQRRKR